jgi:hypothetical protein
MLVKIINELKKRCKEGKHKVNGKCVKLSPLEKKLKKKYIKKNLKKILKSRKKDSKKRAKLSCKDGFVKGKFKGKWKCIKKKDCTDGKTFNISKRKCIKNV